jgi:hypothetical protein
LALLRGPADPKRNAKVKSWATYSYLPDLMVLGMFTGAREDSLCALRAGAVTLTLDAKGKPHDANLQLTNDKNAAGTRLIAVTHPAVLQVLHRRLEGLKPDALLFGELTAGGEDEKFSSSAIKSFGRYRRECGVLDGADFHSFRRRVIQTLEDAGVGQVPIARFIGHKVGTIAGDVYASGSTTKANSIATSKVIRFSEEVESAALMAVQRGTA